MASAAGTVDKVFKAKVQTLLGETGKKADQAVRFRDLSGLDDSVAATKARAEAAEAAIGETTFSLSELQERVDVAEQEVQQAAAAAENALSAANAAEAYTDHQVEAAKDSMAVDYAAAQAAVQDALGAVTHAQDAQAAAEGVFSAVQTLSGQADASRLAAEAAQAASETARTQAQTAAVNADGSASAAAGSASTASTSATEAGDSATAAAASVVAATSARSDAQGFSAAASTSATSASTSASNASTSAAAAATARTQAQTARSGAESARDTAVTARNDAQGAASTATTQAGIATSAATNAGDSATAASTSAAAASSSATDAAQSASAATTQANNASTSAGQASTFAAQAASSATDAQGSASTAATQAGVATSAATNAGDSATAASTSAAAAASSATDAAQSASASQTAKLAAETARGQAQSYRDDASIAATNAWNSAALATTQAGVSAAAASDAAGIVAAVFPADFSAAGRYWTHAIAGYPASRPDRGAPVTFPDDSTWGRVARLSAPITGNQHFAPKSYLQNSAGRRYRLTVEAVHVGAFAGGSENAIYLLFRKFNGAYAATGDLVAGSLMFTAPDTVTTKSIEVTAPGGADPYILPFAYVNALKFGGSGPAILFRSIKIEDITESSAANLSATSSSQSASSASGYADEASAYASAANTARLAAEAAQSGANSASAAATLARDDAVVAANTAEGAAASAQSSVTLASEIVSSEGGGVLDDAFLASSSWVRSPATGSQTFGENTAHPIGRDWTMTVTAATAEGLYVRSTSAIWTGQKSAPAFVVEIDFSLASGTLSGAGVQVQWNDGAARLLNLPLSSMTSSDMLIGVQTARAVFVRPSSYVGPLSFMHVQIFANSAAFGAMAAKVLTIHRVKIRPATDEELGSGQVAAAVQANLNTNYFTRAQTNQAIASFDMSLNTSFSQLSSSVSTQATSIADLKAGATAGYLIKAQAGGAVSLLQLIAADGSGGAPTSVARIAATDILLDGSVAASQLVVTDLSGNMCPDRPWSMGDWAGWSAQSGIDIRKKGFSTTNVAKKMPTAYAARWANVDGASPFAQSIPVNVSAGNTYALQVRTAVASQGTLGRRAQIGLRWLDQNGALISGSYAYTTRTATNTYEVSDTLTATAPEGASYATVWMRSWCVAGTDDGDLYIASPVLTRKSDGAILLKDGTVTAAALNVEQLSAISGDLGSINAGALNINNRFIVNSTGDTTIKSADSGARLVISNNRIDVYDEAGQLRVRMGEL